MKNKKYMIIALLNLILFNNITSMELEKKVNNIEFRQVDSESNKALFNIMELPAELISYVVRQFIEDYIDKWDGIIGWNFVKKDIKQNLHNLFSTCKYLEQFKDRKNIDYIIKNISQSVKNKIDLNVNNIYIKTRQLDFIIDEECDISRYVKKYGWDMIVKLISEGADINFEYNAESILVNLINFNNIEILKSFLNRVDINVNGQEGSICIFIPLMCAVIRGNIEAVKLLLNRKDIDVNLKDIEGNTALMLAKDYGHSEIVELLTPSNFLG